ncbi:MAG: Rne/Rng family ribonuclease [Bacillota bacterium]
MNRILLDETIDFTRIAVVSDGELLELEYESNANESLVGNIYVGRVEKVVPNLQGCFVNIGAKTNGYLYYGKERAKGDTEKNTDKPKIGDAIVVQVEKDATGTKGAMLSSAIAIAGNSMVLLLDTSEVRISKKIKENAERNRIRAIVEPLVKEAYGILVRTNGQGKEKEVFEAELQKLIDLAKKVEKAEYQKPPLCLAKLSSPIDRILRDYDFASIDEFVVTSKETYENLREHEEFSGESQKKLVLYDQAMPLFLNYTIKSQEEKALSKKVWLNSGGFLIIEETEACVVIDVNSGKSAGKGNMEKAVRKINEEAAKEVAKQLRLRNLSGIIIVDFIDMATEEENKAITKILENAVKSDRKKTVVVGMTALGLMQLTRKKTKPSLLRQTTISCKQCTSIGRVPSLSYTVLRIREEVQHTFSNTLHRQLILEANEKLHDLVKGKESVYCRILKEEFQGEIEFVNNADMDFSQYKLTIK